MPALYSQKARAVAASDDLEALALAIPEMGAHQLAAVLRDAAGRVAAGQAIVEVGAWLGASTAHLALGVSDSGRRVPIHVFDRWLVNPEQVEKGRRFGLDLVSGASSLPLFERYLAPFGVEVVPHQGEIEDAVWRGGPIGLYVDDAAKKSAAFHRMLTIFAPHWVPGVTRLILSDFYYFERIGDPDLRYQQRVVEAFPACFRVVSDRPAGSVAIVLDYVAPLPLADLPAPAAPKPKRSLLARALRSVKKRLPSAAR